ncbi:hypothetical protein [Archangium lipolyticum]|uniref:hypothetical protein n=1 Tax=Archangium lipolyticum TaxID=2970465 RepID=UPI002149ACB0|nr:hypothetical protein [Archangium lipolyticum]
MAQVGDSSTALFPDWEKRKSVPVKDGAFSLELGGAWLVGEDPVGRGGRVVLPDGTRLFGQLCIGEKRVYGRITQAVTPAGDTFAVCMELYDEIVRGVESEPDGGAVKVWPIAEVRAVDRFE